MPLTGGRRTTALSGQVMLVGPVIEFRGDAGDTHHWHVDRVRTTSVIAGEVHLEIRGDDRSQPPIKLIVADPDFERTVDDVRLSATPGAGKAFRIHWKRITLLTLIAVAAVVLPLGYLVVTPTRWLMSNSGTA